MYSLQQKSESSVTVAPPRAAAERRAPCPGPWRPCRPRQCPGSPARRSSAVARHGGRPGGRVGRFRWRLRRGLRGGLGRHGDDVRLGRRRRPNGRRAFRRGSDLLDRPRAGRHHAAGPFAERPAEADRHQQRFRLLTHQPRPGQRERHEHGREWIATDADMIRPSPSGSTRRRVDDVDPPLRAWRSIVPWAAASESPRSARRRPSVGRRSIDNSCNVMLAVAGQDDALFRLPVERLLDPLRATRSAARVRCPRAPSDPCGS